METYRKEINGKAILKNRNAIVVIKDKMQIINPSEELVIADGWEKVTEQRRAYQPSKEEIERQNRNEEIASLKQMLSESDYKIIKCMEAYLSGNELPYDIDQLREERNEHRKRINELQNI